MQKYYSYVRNQINKPNQFLDPNVPHSTKGLSSAASSYMSFSGAVRAQLEKNIDTEESYYSKPIKLINDKLDELTKKLEEEEAQKGFLGKVGEKILSCAGCASSRASATSDTSRQIQYYTKELEKIQKLEASEREQMAILLGELSSDKGGGTKNIKKRSKKYRKSNKRTYRRRRIRKTKTQRTRI
jgi:hypothetical protein